MCVSALLSSARCPAVFRTSFPSFAQSAAELVGGDSLPVESFVGRTLALDVSPCCILCSVTVFRLLRSCPCPSLTVLARSSRPPGALSSSVHRPTLERFLWRRSHDCDILLLVLLIPPFFADHSHTYLIIHTRALLLKCISASRYPRCSLPDWFHCLAGACVLCAAGSPLRGRMCMCVRACVCACVSQGRFAYHLSFLVWSE